MRYVHAMKLLRFFLLLGLAISMPMFTSCTTSSPVMASAGGTYTVSKSGQSGFIPLGTLRRQAFEEANEFATKRGKIAEVVAVYETPQSFGVFPKVDLVFRLVSDGDRAAATAPTPSPRAADKSPAREAAAPKYTGTGAIVTVAGHILTAAHVVADSPKISVVTEGGTYEAKVLRLDEKNDLAVLKITAPNLIPLPIVASRGVRLGQPVATIGFPNPGIQGFSPKLTRGEISSLNGFGDDPGSWQISVPVQPGNSGGPLLDASGNLVGVIAAKLSLRAALATRDLPQNVAYAVKSAYALALLEPYLDSDMPAPKASPADNKFEEMVATAQRSAVLILAY